MATLDCVHVCTRKLLVLRSSHVCPRPSHVHPAEEVGIAEKTYERILDLEVTVPFHIPSLASLRGGGWKMPLIGTTAFPEEET